MGCNVCLNGKCYAFFCYIWNNLCNNFVFSVISVYYNVCFWICKMSRLFVWYLCLGSCFHIPAKNKSRPVSSVTFSHVLSQHLIWPIEFVVVLRYISQVLWSPIYISVTFEKVFVYHNSVKGRKERKWMLKWPNGKAECFLMVAH